MPTDNAGVNERSLVVIIACGKAKVWGRWPDMGAVAAREAYTGYPFRVNRSYAEAFADRWYVLSAKYGLLLPDAPVDGPYDVSFLRRRSGPVSTEMVRAQATELGLEEAQIVVVLGGSAYRTVVERALAESSTEVLAPFAGLGIGKMIKATRAAVDAGTSFPAMDT